jgi:hypothetical protein
VFRYGFNHLLRQLWREGADTNLSVSREFTQYKQRIVRNYDLR